MNLQLLSTKINIGKISCLKNVKKICLCFVIIIGILNFNAGAHEHVVRPGENLSQIADHYQVKVADIIGVNGILDANKIFAGQSLKIPSNRLIISLGENVIASSSVNALKGIKYRDYSHLSYNPAPSGYNGEERIHQVISGDTLQGLAAGYNTTIDKICGRNGLAKDSDLYHGQILFIPTETFDLVYYANKEVDLLAKIIAAEARGESLEGQIAVGAVILNRVKDPRFPNSISDVVFEKGQFEVVSNGAYLTVPVTEITKKAAIEALRGNDPTHGALFFFNPRIARNAAYFNDRLIAVEIGNHLFTY